MRRVPGKRRDTIVSTFFFCVRSWLRRERTFNAFTHASVQTTPCWRAYSRTGTFSRNCSPWPLQRGVIKVSNCAAWFAGMRRNPPTSFIATSVNVIQVYATTSSRTVPIATTSPLRRRRQTSCDGTSKRLSCRQAAAHSSSPR